MYSKFILLVLCAAITLASPTIRRAAVSTDEESRCYGILCQNGGKVVVNSTGTGFTLSCTCLQGFGGSHCEQTPTTTSPTTAATTTKGTTAAAPTTTSQTTASTTTKATTTAAPTTTTSQTTTVTTKGTTAAATSNACASCPCPATQYCSDRPSGYQCITCPAGYTGETCQTKFRDASFYPFGASQQDLVMPANDDMSMQSSISFDFKFYGTVYRNVFVTIDGVIYIGTQGYIPQAYERLPIDAFIGVSPYFADMNTNIPEGGSIFYREERNATVLKDISDDIRSHFPQYRSFSSVGAFIVTYKDVRAFWCANTCGKTCNDVASFQTILTSDGVNSFVTFLYNRLDFVAGGVDCGAYAQIGFNAGDGVKSYTIPSSGTADVSKIALTQSNVNIPGKWMFSVAGGVSAPCG